MSLNWLSRFGVVCGVMLALSIGVPAIAETFTGETALTSFVIGLGATLGAPALLALYLHHHTGARGRFHEVAFAVNLIGLALFGAVSFTLNLVIFFLDARVATELLAGPTRTAVLGSTAIFIVGALLFSASMIRAGVFPRIPSIGYGVAFTLIALLAPLPDTLLISALHVVAAACLLWLSLTAWPSPRPVPAAPARA